MSLAQKYERQPLTKLDILPSGGVGTVIGPDGTATPMKVSAPIDFRQLTRRQPVIISGTANRPQSPSAPVAPATSPIAPVALTPTVMPSPVMALASAAAASRSPELEATVNAVANAASGMGGEGKPGADVALDLLGDVSNALLALMNRCEMLEKTIATTKEQARTELAAANDVAREWQQVAHSLRIKVEQLEKDASIMRHRVDQAEQESARVRTVAEQSQQAAAEAECLSSLFQEKVITAFGVGSAGHSVLESVRRRTQQLLAT